MWQWSSKIYKLSLRTIKTRIHPETKTLFWLLFVGSRGSNNRIRIMSVLRKKPRNRNQLSTELGIDYKGIQHLLKTLEENNLVTQADNKYANPFFVSAFFEANEAVFDEIVIKLKKRRSNQVLLNS